MPRSRPALASLVCGGLIVLAACGGSTAPTTALDRDCSTFSSATVSLRLFPPRGARPQLIQENVAAAERIARAASEVTTPDVKAAARAIADTAEPYAAALRAHRIERAVSLEGVLRQHADRFGSICGLAPSAVYGLPANR